MAAPTKQTSRFDREMIADLPPLAWLFESTPDGKGRLLHGCAVEMREDGFYEGCMASERQDDPREAAEIFGSGLCTRDNRRVFLTASHTFESLYLHRFKGTWSISNSLAFLMAHRNLKPLWNPCYGERFATVCYGIDAYDKRPLQVTEGELFRLIYDNIEVMPDGQFRLIRKPMPPAFSSFDEYTAYIEKTLKLAFQDGSREDRSFQYRPLTTCSSGYDSSCAATLAARLGCQEAITLSDCRGGERDSGKPICESLGLHAHERPRPDRADGTFAEIAPFLANGMGGEDYWLSTFGKLLPARILLTGFHGGVVWHLRTYPSTTLVTLDTSGSTIQEFRLIENFVNVPLPMIGARRHPEISQISYSEEMSAFRLYTEYDRPIPRRIMEEAGVGRKLFGQIKKAASLQLFLYGGLLAKNARRKASTLVPRNWVYRAKFGWRAIEWTLRKKAFGFLMRCCGWLPHNDELARILVSDWRIAEHGHPRCSLDFLAGLRFVTQEYQVALSSTDKKDKHSRVSAVTESNQ